jgi:hypothetical protein
MRRLALLIAPLAICSLAFAPAPLPRPDRQTLAQKRERALAECRLRLSTLGVTWFVHEGGGRPAVVYVIEGPGQSFEAAACPVADDLPRALRRVLAEVEAFLRDPNRPKHAVDQR